MQQTITLGDLDEKRHVVSLAASVSPINAFLDEKFPNFVSAVTGFFQNLVKTPPEFQVFSNLPSENVFKDTQVTYTDLGKLKVFIPPGMNGTYLEWLKDLNTMARSVSTIEQRVIDPLTSWLSVLTADNDRFLSRRVRADLGDVQFSDLESLKKTLEKRFTPRGRDTASYKDVVRRNKDWDDITERLNEVNELLSRTATRKIHEKVEELSGVLNMLLEALQDPEFRAELNEKHEKLFNRDIVKEVSDLVYKTAQEVEFYSIVVYYLEATNAAYQDSLEKVETTLKRYSR